MAIKPVSAASTNMVSANTAVQINTTNMGITSITFQALPTNAGLVWVGDSTVSAAASKGIALNTGEVVSFVADLSGRGGGEEFILSDFWINSATTAAGVSVTYITRR